MLTITNEKQIGLQEGGKSFHLACVFPTPGLNGPASTLLSSLSIRLPEVSSTPTHSSGAGMCHLHGIRKNQMCAHAGQE